MITSYKLGFTYIGVPKTGTVSVEAAILEKDPDAIVHPEKDDRHNRHHKGSWLPNDLPRIGFVRDPYRWIESQYSFNLKKQHRWPGTEEPVNALGEIFRNFRHTEHPDVADICELYFVLKHWFLGWSQSYFLDEVDHVYLYEDLPFWAKKHDLNLQKLNTSSQTTLTKEARPLVKELWKEDFELYDFWKEDEYNKAMKSVVIT